MRGLEKKLKNFWKKFLTKEKRSDIIKNRCRTRRVPCKLNNVTNTKHQKVMVVFKSFEKSL